MFDYDATDISRAYAAARTLREPRRQVWRGHLIAYAERVATRTFSTLQLISDDEFDCRAGEFRRYCLQEDRGQSVEEVIDTFLFRRAESVPCLRSGRCEGDADELHHRP